MVTESAPAADMLSGSPQANHGHRSPLLRGRPAYGFWWAQLSPCVLHMRTRECEVTFGAARVLGTQPENHGAGPAPEALARSWVPGHSGDPENTRADALAHAEAERMRRWAIANGPSAAEFGFL